MCSNERSMRRQSSCGGAGPNRHCLRAGTAPIVETTIHRLDLKPGGLLLLEMHWNGQSSYQRGEYVEVVSPERLVWLHSNADSDWRIAGNPRMPDWPRVMLTTVTFEGHGAQTRMRLAWAPHDASEPRSPVLPPQSTALARAGMRGWNCWQRSWGNCRDSPSADWAGVAVGRTATAQAARLFVQQMCRYSACFPIAG
jgi:uncharacterized protein YndB with AHSA1/START domain